MALQIINDQGIFKIKGKISTKNAKSLQSHLEQLLATTDTIILCLDQVKKIDTYGVHVLTHLYKEAMNNNTIFHIIGRENKIIKNAFGKVNYILRSDFV